jgi:hypothetical protein
MRELEPFERLRSGAQAMLIRRSADCLLGREVSRGSPSNADARTASPTTSVSALAPGRCSGTALTCSRKTDPGVMRVNRPGTGKEILDEAKEAHPRAGRPQAT